MTLDSTAIRCECLPVVSHAQHLLTLDDVDHDAIAQVFSLTESLKAKHSRGIREAALRGRVMALLFGRAAPFTRACFEISMAQLGGHSMVLDTDPGVGYREAPHDFSRVLGRFADIAVLGNWSHPVVAGFAADCPCSVINAGSQLSYPSQILADVYTLQECLGRLGGRTVSVVGDGNSPMAQTLAIACVKLGMRFVLAAPEGCQFKDEFMSQLVRTAPQGEVQIIPDPQKAVNGAAVVYASPWTGAESTADGKCGCVDFTTYRVDDKLMACAPCGAFFMHGLTASPGSEVAKSVLESPQSMVNRQIENRLHLIKGLCLWLLKPPS